MRHSTDECDPLRVQTALQRELGLPLDPNVPLFGFIGRLVSVSGCTDSEKEVQAQADQYARTTI
jgi:glycogen synthase